MSILENSSLNGLTVHVAASRLAMGTQAATAIANEIRTCLQRQHGVRIVFAAAPSQAEMLTALRKESDIDWTRITAFHMDDYIGLPQASPQRFGTWTTCTRTGYALQDPVEEPQRLDERRRQIGLAPEREFLKSIPGCATPAR